MVWAEASVMAQAAGEWRKREEARGAAVVERLNDLHQRDLERHRVGRAVHVPARRADAHEAFGLVVGHSQDLVWEWRAWVLKALGQRENIAKKLRAFHVMRRLQVVLVAQHQQAVRGPERRS